MAIQSKVACNSTQHDMVYQKLLAIQRLAKMDWATECAQCTDLRGIEHNAKRNSLILNSDFYLMCSTPPENDY